MKVLNEPSICSIFYVIIDNKDVVKLFLIELELSYT